VSSKDLVFWTQRVESQLDLTPCDGCDSCGLRCTAGVPMSRAEYEGVIALIERSPDRDYIQQVTRQDKRLDLGDGIAVEMCRFRDMQRGRCAIYPARPLVCRLMGHLEWMPCPIDKVRKPIPTPDALALLNAYSQNPRHPFEQWDGSPA
jgi:hypothetical protein